MGLRRGRRKPYTDAGIRRIPCARCEWRKAAQQWQICANGNRYLGVCTECDVELNRMVLEFMGWSAPHARLLIIEYERKLGGSDGND